MGLDLIIYNPSNREDSQFFHGNEWGSVMRLVKEMEHYCLVATSGKRLRELKLDILRHIGLMIKHENLQSDLKIMAQLVGELNNRTENSCDDWIVEWDY